MITRNKALTFWPLLFDLSDLHISKLRSFAVQDKGSRERQQDCFAIVESILFKDCNDGTLLVLADGMGGYLGGEKASQIVVESFTSTFTQSSEPVKDRFEQALKNANQIIADYTAENPRYSNMGTTVVAALILDSQLFWLSVGDSPLWLLRNGQIRRLNEDHSMLPVLNKMVQMGEISQQDADSDSRRHALRSSLNGNPCELVDRASVEQPIPLIEGDTLILASDGIQTLGESSVATLINNPFETSCKAKATRLLDKVKQTQAVEQDNTSVIVVRLNMPKLAYLRLMIMVSTVVIVWMLNS